MGPGKRRVCSRHRLASAPRSLTPGVLDGLRRGPQQRREVHVDRRRLRAAGGGQIQRYSRAAARLARGRIDEDGQAGAVGERLVVGLHGEGRACEERRVEGEREEAAAWEERAARERRARDGAGPAVHCGQGCGGEALPDGLLEPGWSTGGGGWGAMSGST